MVLKMTSASLPDALSYTNLPVCSDIIRQNFARYIHNSATSVAMGYLFTLLINNHSPEQLPLITDEREKDWRQDQKLVTMVETIIGGYRP